ncbi:MAG: hypothetical protein V3U46_05275 [Acidimicrobiia bacterium]
MLISVDFRIPSALLIFRQVGPISIVLGSLVAHLGTWLSLAAFLVILRAVPHKSLDVHRRAGVWATILLLVGAMALPYGDGQWGAIVLIGITEIALSVSVALGIFLKDRRFLQSVVLIVIAAWIGSGIVFGARPILVTQEIEFHQPIHDGATGVVGSVVSENDVGAWLVTEPNQSPVFVDWRDVAFRRVCSPDDRYSFLERIARPGLSLRIPVCSDAFVIDPEAGVPVP